MGFEDKNKIGCERERNTGAIERERKREGGGEGEEGVKREELMILFPSLAHGSRSGCLTGALILEICTAYEF